MTTVFYHIYRFSESIFIYKNSRLTTQKKIRLKKTTWRVKGFQKIFQSQANINNCFILKNLIRIINRKRSVMKINKLHPENLYKNNVLTRKIRVGQSSLRTKWQKYFRFRNRIKIRTGKEF